MAPRSATPRIPVEERRRALDAAMPDWIEGTIDDRLRRQAALYPNRPMVISDEVTLTYSDVMRDGEVLARGLASMGVRPGDRIALLMANHPEFMALAYAAWRVGAALIPVNFAFRAKELGYVLAQSECRLLITMASFRDLDYLAMLDEIAPRWMDGATPELPHLEVVIARAADRPGVLGLDDLRARGVAHGEAIAAHAAGPHDAAVIMYTSGTTGPPKGVVQTHDNVLRSAYSNAYHRAYEDGRRILFALPLYHAFGLILGMLGVPWVGGAVIPQLQFDPTATLEGIERHRATDVLFVPTMTMAVLDHPRLGEYDLSSLFSVHSAAAPTPVRVWQEIIIKLGVSEVYTGYGMTELTSATATTLPGDPLDLIEKTVGCVLLGGAAGIAEIGGRMAEYRTADPISGELLPDGAEGELVCRTMLATKGYFGRPDLSESLFLAGGWLRSGDLGRVRPDGYIELTGRSKELYKTGGELVAPREVEDVLNAHPAVSQSYVIGVPDDRWGEIGAAWIVPTPDHDVVPDELVAWCRERLAKYKQPRHILFLEPDELPRTPTGKVQKFELVKRARAILGT